MPKTELLIIMAIIGILKIGLIFLIRMNIKSIHRITQLLILFYIIGIIWL